jgi:uncharacterized protein
LEKNRRIEGIVEYIAGKYRSAAEIGIGHFPDVADALLNKGLKVFATDIQPFLHDGLEVVVDDITEPDIFLYSGTDVLYAMRTPTELVPFILRLAKTIHADLIVKPLSSEFLNGQLISHGGEAFYLWQFSSSYGPLVSCCEHSTKEIDFTINLS